MNDFDDPLDLIGDDGDGVIRLARLGGLVDVQAGVQRELLGSPFLSAPEAAVGLVGL